MARGQLAKVIELPGPDARERRKLLGPEIGTQFDVAQRLFGYYGNGDVFDYGEFLSRDVDVMLSRDGIAGALESAITLPLRQAIRSIEKSDGDSGQADFVRSVLMDPEHAGGMSTPISEFIGQLTGAQIHRKSFHEKVWDIRPDDGKLVYHKLAYRPTASCELRRNAQTAAEDGFRQQVWLFGQQGDRKYRNTRTPGYVDIPKIRSAVYIHGKHRNPLSGTSEMEIAYWCYQTKMKLLFLWMQFLELQSLPKVLVYGNDDPQAAERAADIASLRSSGVIGMERGPAGTKDFDIIESSGKGADQFKEAMAFLESWQTMSLLASFLGLSGAATQGRGSFALSKDQSSFFLMSRQAIAVEMAEFINHKIIGPLVAFNYGVKTSYPEFKFGPLTDDSEQALITLFQTLATAPALQVPNEILDLITERLAGVLNLDQKAVEAAVQKGAQQRAEAARQAAQAAQQGPPAGPDGPAPAPPPEAAASIGALSGGVDAALRVAKNALSQSKALAGAQQ